MKFEEINEEVLFTVEPITMVNRRDIEFLKKKASFNQRMRVRLCTHLNVDDNLHEMLVVHARGNYVRPHKHPQKSESFHVIEGRMKVLIFDELGNVRNTINMGCVESDAVFYYRLSKSHYHTMITNSEFVVFHETTKGPFRRDTIFAPWAPEEHDFGERQNFLKQWADNKFNRGLKEPGTPNGRRGELLRW